MLAQTEPRLSTHANAAGEARNHVAGIGFLITTSLKPNPQAL